MMMFFRMLRQSWSSARRTRRDWQSMRCSVSTTTTTEPSALLQRALEVGRQQVTRRVQVCASSVLVWMPARVYVAGVPLSQPLRWMAMGC